MEYVMAFLGLAVFAVVALVAGWLGDKLGERMKNREHMVTVEQVNEILRGSYDEYGVSKWWNRPRQALGDRTPLMAWMDEDFDAVLELAQWLTDGG